MAEQSKFDTDNSRKPNKNQAKTRNLRQTKKFNGKHQTSNVTLFNNIPNEREPTNGPETCEPPFFSSLKTTSNKN